MPLLLLLRPSRKGGEPSPYPLGYEYYVDQGSGNDANDGSIDAPWASLSRVHEFARARSPLTATLTLSSAAVGERTATLAGAQVWLASHVGWNINLRSGANTGAATILSVDGGVATVMVTVEAPATEFLNANWSMTQQLDGATDRVWVKAATWSGPAVPDTTSFDNNTLNPGWAPAEPTRLEVHFEAGSVMDDGQADPGRSCFYVTGGANFTLAIYGDESERLPILNYGGDTSGGVVGGSGQPFGGSGAAKIEGYNFHISVCGDGISLHDDSFGHFENGYIEKWQKLGIANVQQSWADFVNVELVSNGLASIANALPTTHSNRCSFLDCKVYADPALVAEGATVAVQSLGGGSWVGGQVGSPIRAASLNNIRDEADTYTDCYLNAETRAAAPLTLTRCFGRYTYRQNNNIAVGQTLRNCVFVGGSTNRTGVTSGLFYRDFNPGGDAQRSVLDCVISGYTGNAAAGANYASQDSGYWIASPSELRFCCFHNNTLNVRAALANANTADGGTKIANNLTVDPQLADAAAIAAGSVDIADYCVTNAVLIGAGSSGGNVGFVAGDLG